MPFSKFDDDTHKLLRHVFDGALIVLTAMKSDAISDERRAETVGKITRQLAEAASEGERDFLALQLRALDGIE